MNKEKDVSPTVEFEQIYEITEKPALPEKLSDYRFVSCLADSGYKKTFLLENTNERRVLCKYATGQYIDMLRTESEFFSRRKFPFIPYILGYFETEEGAYLLREYIEGQTLGELVEKNGPLLLNEAVLIIEQLCGHLSRLHEAAPPIIFRDLKPDNIVLHPSGDCYLIDTGAVRTYHTDNSPDTVFIGTIDTAAPEQFGARQTDRRTDIYALGILFYYLLTGELKIQESRLKELHPRMAAIIRKCTAFDPNDRYQRVSMVSEALHPDKSRRKDSFAAAIVFCVVITLSIILFFSKNAASREVVFTSPLLEQAVRDALNKTDGQPVYERDLEQMTHIYICGDKVFHNETEHNQYTNFHSILGTEHGYGDITDISLLAKMPNLRHVVLDYQQIYDISPLRKLQLTSLSLCGNPVSDLSALEGQQFLRELYLSQTMADSLESLRECSALTTLDCTYTYVNSLEPLSTLQIHHLYLVDAPITDYEPISTVPVDDLYCSNMSAAEIESIKGISSLHTLVILHSNIASLKELSDFSYLTGLDVTNNRLTDLEGLEGFTSLQYIVLSDNPIVDMSPLKKMRNLSMLTLATGTNLDFSFLNEMPWVAGVAVDASQLEALYEAVPEPWFSIEVFE